VTQLALTLWIAIVTTSAPNNNPAPQALSQSEQDRRDYEAYESALRVVNAEAERMDQARANLEGGNRAPAPAISTATRSVAMLGSPALTNSPETRNAEPSASRAAPATLVASYGPTPTTAPPAVRASVGSASASGAPAGCSLFESGYATVPTEKCLQCHGLSRTHPVDLDYAATIQKNPAFMYRPLAEVIKRGVFLPNGQIACVTCHDANSPWQDRIALPPGTQARPAVDPRNRDTYASPQAQPAATLPAHSAVTPTPLCQACHTYGD
jgi:hypothetical protein